MSLLTLSAFGTFSLSLASWIAWDSLVVSCPSKSNVFVLNGWRVYLDVLLAEGTTKVGANGARGGTIAGGASRGKIVGGARVSTTRGAEGGGNCWVDAKFNTL
jgi:hypothetical protein